MTCENLLRFELETYEMIYGQRVRKGSTLDMGLCLNWWIKNYMNGSGWSVERHHWADCEEKNGLVNYIEEWGKQMMSYGCINYLIIAACHDPVLYIIILYTFTILYAFSAGHLKKPNRISANGKNSRYVEIYCCLPLSEVCR